MLWRVRATMPDRPGSLARLAAGCGAADVNILGMQVFPGPAAVTDELVLSAPDAWAAADLVVLLERAGAETVVVRQCTQEALDDQPARFVQAAREVLAQPASFPAVVARLFDADADADQVSAAAADAEQDVMELSVGKVLVQIRRSPAFTAVERARGVCMAELVSDVLGRQAPAFVPSGTRRMGNGATPTYAVRGERIVAMADGVSIGVAVVHEPGAEPGVRAIDIDVDAAWQRRGIGTRLLGDAARLARRLGAEEVVLTTAHDNRAVLPTVLAAGMRGRIRMAGETLTVRVVVRELRPLPG